MWLAELGCRRHLLKRALLPRGMIITKLGTHRANMYAAEFRNGFGPRLLIKVNFHDAEHLEQMDLFVAKTFPLSNHMQLLGTN
jgi:hypothetical protein